MQHAVLRRSWPEGFAMTAVFVANGVAFGAWAGNIPRLKEAAGLGDAALGIVLLCVSLGAIAAMQVAGRWGARIGTARSCWMSAVLLAAVLPLPSLASGYPVLLGSGVVLGLGLGLLDVSMNAHAAWMERQWGAAIMSSFHAGWSFGQLAGAALAWALAGIALAGALLVAACIVLAAGLAALLLTEAPRSGVGHERVAFGWPSRGIVVLGLLVGLSFAVEGGTADWSGVYLRTVLDVSAGGAASALGVFAGAMVVMRLVGDRLVRRFGRPAVVGWGAAAACAGLVLALLAPHPALANLGFGLVGLGIANVVPVAFSLAGGAAGVSIVATAGYGAMMGAPPLIGFVSEWSGLRSALALLAAAAAAMALLARFTPRQAD